MREIVLDTETTGLNPLQGDRLVEIGCVEVINHMPTDKFFHIYLNPERDVPDEAARIHGLTTEFLQDKPVFAEQVDSFLDFIAKDVLVIHNAPFDMGFLNAELTRLGFKTLSMTRVIDTLPLARRLFPGTPASLDALCKRFDVDASARDFHGALLDAQLLADVYLELCGGRQPDLDMGQKVETESHEKIIMEKEPRFPREHAPNEEEITAHDTFLKKIKDALWTKAG
ncbi:MAG TPA: DNA polymerase III subunit epsilon [Rhodospirillaceae bacterium]|nr:DNA polymerase III subunit epsilon [Rhodospirillaceae bacterium]